MVFSDEGAAVELDTTVYERDRLLEGNRLRGPAIVEQLDSTTLISPGLDARVAGDGGMIIDCKPSENQEASA